MDLRTLRYFVALAQEGSVSAAAKYLHVTQPTLSRQLVALEDDLGQQLFLRDHRGIVLTREGHVLLRYAEDILALSDKAREEVSTSSKTIKGRVYIAAGESQVMGVLARAMTICKERYPGMHFQVFSGPSAEVWDGLAKGRFDILLECEIQPHVELNTYKVPFKDEWCVLMRRDDDLARQEFVTPDDLRGRRIVYSQQAHKAGVIKRWAGDAFNEYEVSCNWTLPLNSKYLVREGLGLSLTYMGLFDDEGQDLCCRPLRPKLESTQGLVWRKTPLSPQAKIYLDTVIELCESEEGVNAMRQNAYYTNFS